MNAPVLRFAPSPNGELHLGHAYSALLNDCLARRLRGRLLLRIEDIDITRCTPAFEAGIVEDLRWLGIEWEEPVRRQSDHFDDYRAALDRLIGEGLVYPAFMSRGDIRAYVTAQGGTWPRDPDGVPLYPGLDRELAESVGRQRIASGEPFAWRLDMEKAVARIGGAHGWTEFSPDDPAQTHDAELDPRLWGDVIVARREIPTSYHLSVVIDDALQGVTHVVRGMDLRAATGIHRVLQQLLGLPAPVYHHHRLILAEDGRKLSKSRGDTGLAALRAAGQTPESIRMRLGFQPSGAAGRCRP